MEEGGGGKYRGGKRIKNQARQAELPTIQRF